MVLCSLEASTERSKSLLDLHPQVSLIVVGLFKNAAATWEVGFELPLNVDQDVQWGYAVGVVLPVAVHYHRGLAVKPRQVVVGAATMHRVKGRCCGQNVRCGGVQLVAIVTCVYNMHSTPQGTVSMGIIASRHFTYCMHSIARCILV